MSYTYSQQSGGYGAVPGQAGYPPGGPPGQPGYPPTAGGQPGYPPPAGGQPGYPPPAVGQPGYPPPAGGQPGYPPSAGGQPGYPPAGAQPGYPPFAGSHPGYPPAGAQPGYPPPAGGQAGYPPPAGYAPQQAAYQGQAPAGSVPGVDMPTYKGDIPAEDVMDNDNIQEPTPSAPPMSDMDQIPGYGQATFGGGYAPPPPTYDEATRPGPPEDRQTLTNLPKINEDQAREALLQYVSEHCCFGSGAAKDMKINDLKSSSAFHYTLETYGEARTTAWAYEPFKGQPINGPQNGPAPLPWAIPVNPSKLFEKQVMKVEVPHTASVKTCHTCVGMGRVRCHRCCGRGRVRCSSCHGRGRVTDHHDGGHKDCTWCHGSGRKRCMSCHGHGQVNCKMCQAAGQLKCYIQLTINWENHFEDHIVERTELPDQLIRGVQGQTAFQEEYPRVWPINHFPDQQINGASSNLVQKHSTAFPAERILMQRHKVRIVPVTEVLCDWSGKNSSYFVYGFENKVHAPDYPQTCCCGCSIL